MNRLIAATLLLTCMGSVTAQGIYRWVDNNGVTHFGDAPPSPKAERIQLDVLNTVGSQTEVAEPSTQQQAPATKQQPQITMYSAEWCGVCKKAQAYFKKNNIQYTDYDVEKSSKGKRDYAKMKSKSVPQFVVGDEKVRGFSAKRFDKFLGRDRS